MINVQSYKSELLSSRSNGPLKISLVVPVFNEADAVESFIEEVGKVLNKDQDLDIEIVFVNDGSTDDTLEKLLNINITYCSLVVIDLTRNFGKEAALTAGLRAAKGRVVVPIDVDLQDPPDVIHKMIGKWRKGYDIVLARRANRDTDKWMKRNSANLFYYIHNKLSNVKIHPNVGDYRLLDRKVVDVLNDLPEAQRFMKGLYSWIGFEHAVVDYSRAARSAGISKFNGWRLWNLALEAITGFSTTPLRVWTYLGLFVAVSAFLYATIIAVRVMIFGVEVSGYASIITAISLIGGIQLIGIGIIGEYLGRVYMESKGRPIYLIKEKYENNSQSGK